MPQIGLVQPGVWIASAFGGHGLNTAAMAGELVAGAMAGQDDRWRLFIPFGLVWSGGRSGRVATQVSYWSMQFRDWIDEVQTKRVEQVQADIAAGLAPGLAAFAARRAKRKFAESRAGRISARLAAAASFVLGRLLAGARWVGAGIYAVSAAVGRVLYVVIMAIATVIGFIAGWVGWGMEMIAAGIVVCARAAGRAAVLFWRRVIVPLSLLVAAMAGWAWRRSRLGSTRLALAIQAWGRRTAERVKAGLAVAGHRLRAGAIHGAARAQDGLRWCRARIREAALWTAAQATAGARRAAAGGKQAALASGARTRDGALSSARRLAAWSRRTWEGVILPGARRAASSAGEAGARIRSEGARWLEHARANTRSLGGQSTEWPGIAWNRLLVPAAKYALERANGLKEIVADARKRHAEADRAAEAARKEIGEAVKRAEAEAQKKAAAEKADEAQETDDKPKKKKKAGAKQDSVEA